ncbi:MAG: hypothetical protein M1817_002193 [Caeruleum heppii]|nr:MAG: hypothetical protein M1817_002193 [Caeruleum heppii]
MAVAGLNGGCGSSVNSSSATSSIEPDSPTYPSSSVDTFLSSTASLTSSIVNYPIENGRRYHKYREGCYVYPNDDTELERLDMQYDLLKRVFHGRTHFAPLSTPKKILDVATGTGIWPIEMGMSDQTRTSQKTNGAFEQLISSLIARVPDNVHFVIDDAAEEDWLYPPNTFDYIHTRILLGCFEDFREIIKKGFRYTKPGGWMESQEVMSSLYCDDGTIPPNWPMTDWTLTLDEASMQNNRPLRIANKLKRWYEEAGFVDVHEQVFKMPLNPWAKDPHYKEIGRAMEVNMLDGIQAFSLASFYRVFGWSKSEIEVYLVNVRKALSDRNVHAYHKA